MGLIDGAIKMRNDRYKKVEKKSDKEKKAELLKEADRISKYIEDNLTSLSSMELSNLYSQRSALLLRAKVNGCACIYSKV